MTELEDSPELWEKLAGEISAGQSEAIVALLEELSADEQGHAVAHLTHAERGKLLDLLPADRAARLAEDLPDALVVDLFSDAEPGRVAAVVDSLPDSVGASLLREMPPVESDAVLAELDDDQEVAHLRELQEYPWDSAGGLMTESYVSFREDITVGEILEALSHDAERYSDMDVQYVYITRGDDKLSGVLRLRDLVVSPRTMTAAQIMLPDPNTVRGIVDLETLRGVFKETSYVGLPVVDADGVLLGVVTAEAVQEASAEHQTEDFLNASGIVGGEELRSMKLRDRCLRRLAWLAPNIVLNLIAASVIAQYEDTIQAVIALAIFLPIISDMSGCSGNQSVAVSIRELTLGLIRPTEFWRVVWGEGLLGIFNGLVLGTLLGTIAGLWKDSFWLGVVIGGSLAFNTVVSVLLGGLVPLLLKRLRVDPALASGPILTTVTDMCGFFVVLNLATVFLNRLV